MNGQIRRAFRSQTKVVAGFSWINRSSMPLLIAGGISASLYLILTLTFLLPTYAAHHRLYDLIGLTGGTVWSVCLYALFVIAVFVVYWQSWRQLCAIEKEGDTKTRSLLAIVVVGAVLFAAVLVWMYPITATDLFQYFFRSRILSTYQESPFVATPADFLGDPYLYAVGEWTHIGSLYGPAWELLAAGAALVSRGALVPNLLALKGISALFYAGSVLLVHRILDRAAPQQRASGTLLFAWNPLILLEWVGNGHNDAAMIFFVLLGVWLWTHKRHTWVVPAFVAAALCKATAAIAIPPFVLAIWINGPGQMARWRWLARSLILSVLVATALCAPFGLPWQNVGGILQETAGDYGYSLSATLVLIFRQWAIPTLARCVASPARTLLVIDTYVYSLAGWLAMGALAALYARQLIAVWQGKQDPVSAGAEAFFATALLVPSYRMWYATWAMALAALCPKRERLLRVGSACFAAALSGLVYARMNRSNILPRHFLGVAFTLALPVLLPVLVRWIQRAQHGQNLSTDLPTFRKRRGNPQQT